jgi:hypothetical protein
MLELIYFVKPENTEYYFSTPGPKEITFTKAIKK